MVAQVPVGRLRKMEPHVLSRTGFRRAPSILMSACTARFAALVPASVLAWPWPTRKTVVGTANSTDRLITARPADVSVLWFQTSLSGVSSVMPRESLRSVGEARPAAAVSRPATYPRWC